MRQAASRAGFIVVGFVVSAVFLWLAVQNVDVELFLDALGGSYYIWLLPALAGLAVGTVIRTVRWGYLFEPARRPPFGARMRALLVGLLFNAVLPARAGEAARVVVLNQETGTSRVEALATAVAERVYDVLALLFLLFAVAPFLPPEVTWLRRAGVAAAALGLGFVIAIVVLDRYGTRPVHVLMRPLTRFPRVSGEHVEHAAENLVRGLAALHRPRLAVPTLGLTILSWLVLAFAFWCVLEAFRLELGYDAGVLILVTTALSLVIPSAPGGLGVFEAGGMVALRAYGVEDSLALSCVVVLHVLNLVPAIVAGAVVLHRHVRLLPALRQEAKARLDA